MIVHASELQEINHRIDYRVMALQDTLEHPMLKHFVARVTLPENPFGPHKHEGAEFWFIIEGEAIVSIDGQESAVVAGDLVYLAPWTNHGLHTEGRVRWVCLG